MSGIDSIIAASRDYVGTVEGSDKHREIINLYNKGRYSDAYQMTMYDPWCAAFVVAMFVKCEMADIIPGYAYCDGMINTFKQWGRWKTSDPNKGDIAFYDWDGNNSSDHVGIVCDVNNNLITVIEGNKSDAVGYRQINRNSSQIMGFGVPNYEGSSGIDYTSNISPIDNEYIRTLPLLQYGSKGVYVKILQVLLNYYNSANLDADGDFGSRTKSALADYQTKYSLEVDGVAGKETWSHILLKQ